MRDSLQICGNALVQYKPSLMHVHLCVRMHLKTAVATHRIPAMDILPQFLLVYFVRTTGTVSCQTFLIGGQS